MVDMPSNQSKPNLTIYMCKENLIPDIGIMVRVFAKGPGFNPTSSHTKDSKNGTGCFLA